MSFYLLTLSEKVPLYEKRDEIPDDDVLREMYFLASRILLENGYSHYEISNASLPGFESRHNTVYWEGGDYLGFGPGAHSLFQNKRFSVLEGAREFVTAKDIFSRYSDFEIRTREDIFQEYIMLSLRQKKGLSLKKAEELSDSLRVKEIEKNQDQITKQENLVFPSAANRPN